MLLYDDKKFIGKKIKQLRISANLSQAELSEKIGMTEKNLSNIERGLQMPALNSFLKLLNVLNISLAEFGIEDNKLTNTNRDEIIKEIFLSSEKEIDVYLSIIRGIKSLN